MLRSTLYSLLISLAILAFMQHSVCYADGEEPEIDLLDVASDVEDAVDSILGLTQSKNSVNIKMENGCTSIDKGPMPEINIWDVQNVEIADYPGSNDISQCDTNDADTGVIFNAQHHSINIRASDVYQGKSLPVCITYIAVSPESTASTDPYALLAGTVALFDRTIPTYVSGQTLTHQDQYSQCSSSQVDVPCMWMSSIHTNPNYIFEITISDMTKYYNDLSAYPPRIMTKDYFSVERANGVVDKSVLSRIRSGNITDIPKPDLKNSTGIFPHGTTPYAFVHTGTGARSLCKAHNSAGPDFLSLEENIYCSVMNKMAYGPCKDGIKTGCYTYAGTNVTLHNKVPSRASDGRTPKSRHPKKATLKTRKFITKPSSIDTKSKTKNKLSKRDAICVPVSATSTLAPNTVLTTTQYMISPSGTYMLLLQSDGNLVLTTVSDGGVVWAMGADNSGNPNTYTMGVQGDGNLCVNGAQNPYKACLFNYVHTTSSYTLNLNDCGSMYATGSSGGYAWMTTGSTAYAGGSASSPPCNVPTAGKVPVASQCISGYSGIKNGLGPKCACCITQSDCDQDCVSGLCTDSSGDTSGCGSAPSTGGGTVSTIVTGKPLPAFTPLTNGKCQLSWNGAGTIVIMDGTTEVWDNNYSGYDVNVIAFTMQSDGNLCVSNTAGNIWCAMNFSHPTGTYTAKLDSSCVLSILTASGSTIWATAGSSNTGGSSAGTCTSGYSGLGNGNGPKCACCTASGDCDQSCDGGICSDSAGDTSGCGSSTGSGGGSGGSSCTSGYSGKGNGNGPTGACCASEADCNSECTNGICNGT